MSRSALALRPVEDVAGEGVDASAMRLTDLLAAAATRHPKRRAFVDQPGRESWSGRPCLPWSYGRTRDEVGRLAGVLARLGLPAGSPIGICLPSGTEACLSLLAAEKAGLVPCILPLAWSEDELAACLEASDVQGLITQSEVGEERPAARFCHLAARHYGLRFLCAFGPHVPDGVIDLDRMLAEAERPSSGKGEEPRRPVPTGIITFSRRDGSPRPVFRPAHAVVAAGIAFLAVAKIAAGERIVSLLAPDDHRGLTTGLVATLVGGGTLEGHGLFDSGALLSALEGPRSAHLVAPAWMEDALADSGLAGRARSVILVHEAPTRFSAGCRLPGTVIDVLAFDELALLAAARDETGAVALSLGGGADDPIGAGLIQVRRDPDGAVLFDGPSAEVRDYDRHEGRPGPVEPGWRVSGFRMDLVNEVGGRGRRVAGVQLVAKQNVATKVRGSPSVPGVDGVHERVSQGARR